MNKKLLLIMLALSLTAAVFVTGCSSDDDTTTTNPPAAPTNVAAGLIAPTVARITWTASVLDDAPDGYRIDRRVNEGEWSELATVSTSVTSYNDSSLAFGSGNDYQFRVGAYNAGGTTYGTTPPSITLDTYQELLLGAWDATNSFETVGSDSSSLTFQYNTSNSHYEYRRVDYYDTIDSDQWDAGTYTTDGTAIVFNVQVVDGVPTDSTYTWDYTPYIDGETMTVVHDYGTGTTWDVNYELVSPPVD